MASRLLHYPSSPPSQPRAHFRPLPLPLSPQGLCSPCLWNPHCCLELYRSYEAASFPACGPQDPLGPQLDLTQRSWTQRMRMMCC